MKYASALGGILLAGLCGLTAPASAQSTLGLAARAMNNPDWGQGAAKALPPGWTLGRLYRLDEAGGKAFFAAFPKDADTPWAPGSAFDLGKTVEVRLKHDGKRLAFDSATVAARASSDRDNEEASRVVVDLQAAAAAEAANGIALCKLRGWALSEAKTGTPVRTRPADDAPIAGRLPPPYISQDTDASSINGWRAEFEITGYKDGWFRIANAVPPGTPYGDKPPASHPKTYSGVGWVRTTDVIGAYANTQMPAPRLMQYPHVDAKTTEPNESVTDPDGNLSIDGTLMRLHACSANWGLTTSRDGQRGWWRGICSNQATNCS